MIVPRDDAELAREALIQEVGSLQPTAEISLGDLEAKIYLAFVEEYHKTEAPISTSRAAEIVYRFTHTHSNPTQILSVLERKRVLQSSNEAKNRLRIPVTQGVAVFTGLKHHVKRQIWPVPNKDQENGKEKSGRKTKKEKKPREFISLWNRPFVFSKDTKPVRISPRAAIVYEALLSAGRKVDFAPQQYDWFCKIIRANSTILHVYTRLSAFERQGLVGWVSGEKCKRNSGDLSKRAVIRRPYCVIGVEELVVPPECEQESPLRAQEETSRFESETPLIRSKEELQLEHAEIERRLQRAKQEEASWQTAQEQLIECIAQLQKELAQCAQELQEHEAVKPQANLKEMEMTLKTLGYLIEHYEEVFQLITRGSETT